MSRNKDPFDLWREWIDKAERQLNSTLNDLSETAPYNQVSGKMVQAMMGMQSSFNEATQRYFSTLNLPSRNDIISLADRLESIERRLVSIETALKAQDEGQPTGQADRPRPRRTKKASSRPPVAAPPKAAAAKKSAPKRTASKKAATKKHSTKKVAAKKVTKKKTTKKKVATKKAAPKKAASKKKATKKTTRKASRKKA